MSAPMSIAVACYPSFGGSGIIASEVAVGLARRGHTVHVVASAPPSRALPELEGLFFREVKTTRYPIFEHAPYTLALASSLIELANEQRVDLFHVHYAVPHAASAYLACQALGEHAPRVVTTLHGTDVTVLGADPSYSAITRFAVRASSAVTVPSGYLAQKATGWLDEPSKREIDVIPNFVDTELFAPAQPADRDVLHALFKEPAAPSNPVLFHVSNFRPVKRTGDLIDVLLRVRKSAPARLVLVGDGPDRDHAEQKANALGLGAHVCFLGKRAAPAELLRHADAFVLPSESESFGLAALEALSCGVPVLGYRVGGLPEVVTDDVGVLVAPFNVDALAAAVVRVVSDPDARAELARGARARAVTHFRRDPAIERYEALFRRVLSRTSHERST